MQEVKIYEFFKRTMKKALQYKCAIEMDIMNIIPFQNESCIMRYVQANRRRNSVPTQGMPLSTQSPVLLYNNTLNKEVLSLYKQHIPHMAFLDKHGNLNELPNIPIQPWVHFVKQLSQF